MLQRFYILSAVLLVIAACVPNSTPGNQAPTAIPFPTMTPGRFMRGPLPTLAFLPSNGVLANPATAVALANLPTTTPDFARCPTSSDVSLPAQPISASAVADEIARFLSNGGQPRAVETHLREVWRLMGDDGILRSDLDLTGEGTPDVLLTYETPDDGGTMLILTCSDGRMTTRYHFAEYGTRTPSLIQVGDMNFDNRPDVLFSTPVCQMGTSDPICRYRTHLISWQNDLGRFVNLLDGEIESDTLPAPSDIDNDQIAEIIVRLEDSGNAETGPLRTGIDIWDWNGGSYVASITQLDPPRFRIQVIHEADRALMQLNAGEAIPLYQLALSSPDLEPWRNDEDAILQSYALFKLLQAYAYTGGDQYLETYTQIQQAYPDLANAPVYVLLATTFWNAQQVTNNLRSACLEVKATIQTRPEAIELMNRYGSRSPIYDENTLCPF